MSWARLQTLNLFFPGGEEIEHTAHIQLKGGGLTRAPPEISHFTYYGPDPYRGDMSFTTPFSHKTTIPTSIYEEQLTLLSFPYHAAPPTGNEYLSPKYTSRILDTKWSMYDGFRKHYQSAEFGISIAFHTALMQGVASPRSGAFFSKLYLYFDSRILRHCSALPVWTRLR